MELISNKHVLELQGFTLCTDYKKLYDLICSGFRVPAWVSFKNENNESVWDIVEVSQDHDDEYTYGKYKICNTKSNYGCESRFIDSFIKDCQKWSLCFIFPPKVQYRVCERYYENGGDSINLDYTPNQIWHYFETEFVAKRHYEKLLHEFEQEFINLPEYEKIDNGRSYYNNNRDHWFHSPKIEKVK